MIALQRGPVLQGAGGAVQVGLQFDGIDGARRRPAPGACANAIEAANAAESMHFSIMRAIVIRIMKLPMLLLAALPLFAADEFTVYDLQAPATHSFDIIYDVSATREGAAYFFNPIRPGSTATKERVVDRATGKPLEFEVVDGKSAKASGLVAANRRRRSVPARESAGRVAKGGETRIRI